MVKIILIVAIAALACVNAQNDLPPGFGRGGPGGLFDFFPIFRNFRIPRPQDIYKAMPVDPNSHYQAMYVGSDGNQVLVRKNDNGKTSEFVINP